MFDLWGLLRKRVIDNTEAEEEDDDDDDDEDEDEDDEDEDEDDDDDDEEDEEDEEEDDEGEADIYRQRAYLVQAHEDALNHHPQPHRRPGASGNAEPAAVLQVPRRSALLQRSATLPAKRNFLPQHQPPPLHRVTFRVRSPSTDVRVGRGAICV